VTLTAPSDRIDAIIFEHRSKRHTLQTTQKALEAEGYRLGLSRISERSRALGIAREFFRPVAPNAPREVPVVPASVCLGGEVDAAFRDFERSLEGLHRDFAKLHNVLARSVRP